MSIQAGWNQALGILGGLNYLKGIRSGQKEQTEAFRNIEAERRAQAEFETEELNRIVAENQDDELIRRRVEENREDMSMGIGMPRQRYGTINPDESPRYATEEEIAAYRAAQAAAAADSRPINNINGAADALHRRQNGTGGDN